MPHVREVARTKASNGVAYEAHWRDGDKKLQRTFTVKREAERFAIKVEVAKDAGDTTRSLVKNTATVAQVIAASMEAAKPRLKPRTFHSYELMYSARIVPMFSSRRLPGGTT